MKLLLTSSGITNKSIESALLELLGKRPEDSKVAFVPTAASTYPGDKSWLIRNLTEFQSLSFKEVDIVDISAVERDNWYTRLNGADILAFGGGSAHYLMDWIKKSGLEKDLSEFLKNKIYVGISAGSMVVCNDCLLKPTQILFEEDQEVSDEIKALELVDFYIIPHLNGYKSLNRENIEKATSNIKKKVYCLDDQSALKVVDGQVDVISEGEWFILPARA